MQKPFLYLCIHFIIIQFAICQIPKQNQIEPGWQRINLKTSIQIDIPPTMEIQNGNQRVFVNNLYQIFDLDTTNLTIQQKGLNKGEMGYEKYARVLINTIIGKNQDYNSLDLSPNVFSQSDLNEINKAYKDEAEQAIKSLGAQLIQWNPVKVEKINGMTCYHFSYIRQMLNNPEVLVNTYHFHNNDRLHKLTLSYRISEEAHWQSDFSKILKSFRINMIR